MRLVDSHCHVHGEGYPLDAAEVLGRARDLGIGMICVGTSMEDSVRAAAFARENEGVWASVGVHPHGKGESDLGGELVKRFNDEAMKALAAEEKVVAIGEIGLDYHHKPMNREGQIALFERQLQVASELAAPVVFHVREAFEDFFAIVDGFSGVKRGVVHSFSDDLVALEGILRRGFYVGINGIATFTKDARQIEAFDRIPLERMLVETDAPYLTPKRFRGKLNEPAYVGLVAEWVANRRHVSIEEIEVATTRNAATLFDMQ